MGVSPSTVSFVLNDKDKEMRISTALAQKIRKAALDAGYQRNQVAVSLRTGKSNIIALIVDTISGSFFSELAKTIEAEAQRYGYRVIYCSTGKNIKKSGDLIKMLHQYQVDGYLIIPFEGMKQDIVLLGEKGRPMVLIDTYFPDLKAPHVLTNNASGVSKGVSHLIQHGYQKIGLVCNDVRMVQMQDRRQGYTQTLKKYGLRFSRKLVCETPFDSPKESVVQQITTFIQSAKPDSILFAANYLGVCGLESLRNLGLRIPEDIAVVCFDDLDLFNLYPPGITSIRQPVQEIAESAISLLMDQINGAHRLKKSRLQIEPRMILRQSV